MIKVRVGLENNNKNTPMMIHTINTTFLNHLLSSAEHLLGRDVIFHCKQTVGLPLEHDRTPLELVYQCLSQMSLYYGPRPLGLNLAKHMSPSSFSVVGHLILSSKSLGEALELVVKYHEHIMDCDEVVFSMDKKTAKFSWSPIPGEKQGRDIFVEFVLASIWRFGMWATGKNSSFTRLDLGMKQSSNDAALTQYFGCPIYYGAASNSIVFPVSWCDISMLNQNVSVKGLLASKLDEMKNHHLEQMDVIEKMRKLLTQDHFLREGLIASIAQHLNVSVRTLQRYLKLKSTSFTKELRTARLMKAESLLVSTQKNISDIALEVGYSEQSAFSYAYKQWKGRSPNQERLGE